WELAQAVPDFQRALPESVRGMVETKLARLDEADRRLLAAASVQGCAFDSAVGARAPGPGARGGEGGPGLVERVPGPACLPRREQELADGVLSLRYQSVHALYQNALYAELAPSRRLAWSATAALALLDCHGEQAAAVARELALLFEAARHWAQAADQFQIAAQ